MVLFGPPDERLRARMDYAGERIQTAFQNDNHELPASRRVRLHYDSIFEGHNGVQGFLNTARQLDITRAVRGEDVTPALRNRLRSLSLADIADCKGLELVQELILKLCHDEEVASIDSQAERVSRGWKGLQSLLHLQMNSLVENMCQPMEPPAGRQGHEFYHNTSDVEDLTNYIMTLDVTEIGAGGFGQIYKTELVRGGSPARKVAIKVLKCYSRDIEDPKRKRLTEIRLRREICIWKDLHHINVVPLLGLVHGFKQSPFPSMVCPWMEGGTLRDHLISEREALTLDDRFRLLRDVVEGLSYLHAKSVIHGDLTPSNILISENTARLTDFGVSEILSEFVGTSYMTRTPGRDGGGAVRWAAPELFLPLTDDIHGEDRSRRLSKACDIWSYGCIVQEVISGIVPYFSINEQLVRAYKVAEILPERPESVLLTDDIWEFIQLCWRKIPEFRPEVFQVSRWLQDIHEGIPPEHLEATLPPLIEEAGMELD